MKNTIAVFTALLLMACAPAQVETSSTSGSESKGPRFPSGYVMDFGNDFKAGMNSVDDFGISIVIVMDTSGSMSEVPSSGGRSKYVQSMWALDTVERYLETVAAKYPDMKVQVGLAK